MVKKILVGVAIVIGLVLVLLIGLIGFLTITEYKPEPVEDASLSFIEEDRSGGSPGSDVRYVGFEYDSRRRPRVHRWRNNGRDTASTTFARWQAYGCFEEGGLRGFEL